MLILVIALVVLLYFSNIFSYSMGVKHGREVKQGNIPKVNPIPQRQSKAEKIKEDKIQEGIQNILNYGEPIN